MQPSVRSRLLVGLALALVGLVWIGQGLGLLRGSSFMVDDPRWAAIGLGLVLAGTILAVSAWRSRRTP